MEDPPIHAFKVFFAISTFSIDLSRFSSDVAPLPSICQGFDGGGEGRGEGDTDVTNLAPQSSSIS